jgi:beta-xylosidase
MWAPDCISRNGKYYFYFPAPPKDSSNGRSFAIGVAISDKPYGPLIPRSGAIENVHGFDPDILIDKDDQAYLIWAAGNIYIAELKRNMLAFASKPQVIGGCLTRD